MKAHLLEVGTWGEAGAAVLYRDPLNGATANRAGFPFPMSDLETVMGCARITLELEAVRLVHLAQQSPKSPATTDAATVLRFVVNHYVDV